MKRLLNVSPGQRTAILGVLVLVLVTTCCAPPTPRSDVVPDVRVPSTSQLMYMEVTPTVASASIEMFSYDTETAMCLTGHVRGDTTLVIDGFTLPVVEEASDTTMTFECDKGPGFVGILHTHPRHTSSFMECMPSMIDQQMWSTQPEMLVQIVMCGSGGLWFQVRDGRFWFARWR